MTSIEQEIIINDLRVVLTDCLDEYLVIYNYTFCTLKRKTKKNFQLINLIIVIL